MAAGRPTKLTSELQSRIVQAIQAAILAFALGALVTWMVPEMIKDIREWHREFYPRPTRKPAESCKNSQPVR